MTRLVGLAVATLSLACAHGTSTRAVAEPPSRPAPPSIALSEVSAGQWQVVYRTSQPTADLRFVRNPDDSRGRRWHVENDFELVHENGADLLRRKDHGVFQTAAVTVPARYVALPKEYAPFSPFTDGATLIYSGQFHVCAETAECPSEHGWPITVTPPPGTHLVVAGGLHESAFTFADAGDGTNIYVGKTTPLASSHFVAVIDRGLPEEVKAALYRLLPPMIDFYTTRLGQLPFKPMLFASLDPAPPEHSDFNMQGGTLPGQITYHLYGEKWAQAPKDKLQGLAWYFAHETGHLFQSPESSGAPYPMAESWIHEGGAEAFAALTVSKFGGLSCGHVEQRIESAITECAAGLQALAGRPLDASADAGAFQNYYTCGLVIHLAIDTEIKRTSAGTRDLFDVWSEFLSRARAGEPINQDTFLRTASELGAPKSASFARALATAPQTDPLTFLRTALLDRERICASE